MSLFLGVGNNCTINFLSADRMKQVPGGEGAVLPACLIIEADSDDAAEEAELALGNRIADLFARVEPRRPKKVHRPPAAVRFFIGSF